MMLDGTSGTMVRAKQQGTVTNPMLLAPGKTGAYVIFQDAKRGLYPERL